MMQVQLLAAWSVFLLLQLGTCQDWINNEETINEEFQFYIKSRQIPDSKCMLEEARWCFASFANLTTLAMTTPSWKMRSSMCRDAMMQMECVERVRKCTDEENMGYGLALYPYFNIMEAIMTTACREDEMDYEDLKDSCKSSEYLKYCVMDFFYSAVEVVGSTQYNPSEAFCWQSEKSLSCLQTTVNSCSNNRVRSLIGMLGNQMKITKEDFCYKPGCNLPAAMEGFYQVRNAINSPLTSLPGSPTLCGILYMATQRVKNYTIGCSDEAYAAMGGIMYFMNRATSAVCTSPQTELPKRELQDETSVVLTVLTNPFATEKDICPLMHLSATQLLTMNSDKVSAEEVMHTLDSLGRLAGPYCMESLLGDKHNCNYTMSNMCDMVRAKACINHANLNFYLHNIENLGKDVLCQEISKMSMCIELMTAGCPAKDVSIEMLDPNMPQFFAMVGTMCPLPEMLLSRMRCSKEKCEVRQALMNCFDMPTTAELAAGQAGRFVNETLNCVTQHTSGCGKLTSTQTVAYSLKKYLDYLKPYYYDRMADNILSEGLPDCVEDYIDGVRDIMFASTNFTNDMCMFMAHMDQNEECKSLMSRAGPMDLSGMMIAQRPMEMYYIQHCPMDSLKLNHSKMDTTKEPDTCDSITAAISGSIYWHRFMQIPFLALHERKEICSDGMYIAYDIEQRIANCSSGRKQVFTDAAKMVDMVYHYFCPMDEMEKPTESCNVNASMHCLSMLGEYYSTASGMHMEINCKKAGMALQCVADYSKNCSTEELAALKEQLTPVMALVGNACEDINEAMCNISSYPEALKQMNDPQQCDESAADTVLDLVTTATPVMENNTELLCGMALKATLKAMMYIQGCSDAVKATFNTRVQTLKSSLNATCANTSLVSQETESCPNIRANMGCSVSFDECSASLSDEDICRNSAAVAACVSLKLRGCDDFLVSQTFYQFGVWQYMLENSTGLTCNIMPSPGSGYQEPQFKQDVMCVSGMDVYNKYLYNDTATESNLCDAFTNVMECLKTNVSLLPLVWQASYHKVVETIKKQIYFRCKVVDNLPLVYMDNVKNLTEYVITDPDCRIEEAVACMNAYIDLNMYVGFMPLSERMPLCSKVAKSLMCVHNHTAACPMAIRKKVIRAVDWFDSIGQQMGVCKVGPPKMCKPEEALNCISMMAYGIVGTKGTPEESLICAGMFPMEMCVKNNIMGCDNRVRAIVEDAASTVGMVAYKSCEATGMDMTCTDMEGKCDMEEIHEYMNHLFEMGPKGVHGDRKMRKEACSKMMEAKAWIEKSVTECSKADMEKVKGYSSLADVAMMAVCSEEEMSYESQMCSATALGCIQNYVHVSLTENLSSYCGQAKITTACLGEVMKNCSEEHRVVAGIVGEEIKRYASSLCTDDECKPMQAWQCMSEAESLLKLPPMRFKDSPILCGALKSSLSCTYDHAKSCEAEDVSLLMGSLRMRHTAMDMLCPEMTYNRVIEYSGMYNIEGFAAFIASISNPYATKDSVCPQYKVIQEMMMHAAMHASVTDYVGLWQLMTIPTQIVGDLCYSEMDMEYRLSNKTAQCNITMMTECAMIANIPERIAGTIFYGWEPVCQSLEHMICCLNHASSACVDELSQTVVTQMYHDIFSLVGNGCSVTEVVAKSMMSCEMPMPKRCDRLDVVSSCFLDIRSQNDKRAICSNLTEIVKCVDYHTSGCNSYQNSAYYFGLKKYKEWMQSSCDIALVDVTLTAKDELSEITDCNMDFMDSLYNTLTTSLDLDAGLCRAMTAGMACTEKAEIKTLSTFYFMEGAREADAAFMKEVCNKTLNTASPPAEPATCMLDVAALMATSYLDHLSTMRMLPINHRMEACRSFVDVSVAVEYLTRNCSQVRKDMLGKMMMMLLHIHEEVCPSTLEAVLEMEFVCSPEIAEMCINNFGMYANAMPAEGAEYLCQVFHKTAKCVQGSLKSCPESVAAPMETALYTAKTLMGNTCPLLNGIMCNVSMFGDIVKHATCNQTMAHKCLSDFDYYAKSQKGNMSSICQAYPDVLGCVMINSMLCEKDSTMMLNSTVHMLTSTVGKQCMMNNVSVPHCEKQPVCSILWQECMPMGEIEDVCNNTSGLDIESCVADKMAGCDNHTMLSMVREMRMYANDLAMQSKGMMCGLSMALLNSTAPYVQYLWNDTCDIHFTKNLTAVLKNSSFTIHDVCMLFDNMTKCLTNESTTMPTLYKGISEAATYRIMGDKCYMEGMMALAPNYTSDMAKVMAMNMSQFFNQTTEPEGCHLDSAASCLNQFAMSAFYGGFIPLGDRKKLCSGAVYFHTCVINATAMCSPMTRFKHLHALNRLTVIGKSQGYCQDNPDIAVGGMKGKLMQAECKQDEAMECLGKLSTAVSVYQYSATKQAACSVIQPVQMCVEKYTYNCMGNIRSSIMATYRDLYAAANILCKKSMEEDEDEKDDMDDMDHTDDMEMIDMSKCEMEMKESHSTMCSLPEALMCVTSMEAKMKENSHDGSVCGMLPELKSCMNKYTAGCQTCQKDSVNTIMKAVYSKMMDKCPELMCDACGAMNCLMMFNETVKEHKATCQDMWKAKECVAMHTQTCGKETLEYLHRRMEESLRMEAMPSCKNMEMTQCVAEFGMLAQSMLGLRLKDLPDLSELMDKMDDMDEETTNRTTNVTRVTPTNMASEQQLYILKELHKILGGYMNKNMTCSADSMDTDMDMEMLLMMQDKEAMCKKAGKLGECLMNLGYQLPMEIMPMVNTTLSAIGEAVKDKCYEQSLRCYNCKGARTNEECNMRPKEVCMGKNQVCYADIQNGTMPSFNKGCTARIPMASSRERKCLNGSRCVYMCDKPDCNYMETDKNVDPPSCNRKQAIVCGMDMMHGMMKSKKMDCGMAKEKLYCMHYHLSECISGLDHRMFKLVEEALKSESMVKCYADTLPCKCGSCMTLLFDEILLSPYTQPRDVCSIGMKMRDGVFTSMLMDQCSRDDLKTMYETTKVLRAVMGDVCDMRAIGQPAYNGTCQLDVARSCFAMPIRQQVRVTPKNDSSALCMNVLRIFGCAHMHTTGCELKDSMAELEDISRETIAMVKDHCDTTEISQLLNDTALAARTNDPELLKKIQSASQKMLEYMDKDAMVMFHEVTTLANSDMKACEPSLAYHNCFYYFETETPCDAISKSYECVSAMTSGCLSIQKTTINYIFSLVAPPDVLRSCNFPTEPSEEEMRQNMMDPYYNMSICAITFAHTVQNALAKPDANSHGLVCNMSYYLEGCVYEAKVPELVRPFQYRMAMITGAIREASCYGITFTNVQQVNCSDKDILCHVMKNLTMMDQGDDTSTTLPAEPAECKLTDAAICISSYLSRIITWPFSPVDETDDLCIEQQYLADCIDNNTKMCTYNRRQAYLSTFSWIQSITGPGCSVYGDVSNPTCSKAQMCLKDTMSVILSGKAYEDPESFCWHAQSTMECVKYHAFNCSAMDLSYITESVQILGNFSYYLCGPDMAAMACPLTKLYPKQEGTECQTNKMRQCVNAYYEHTYMKSLDQTAYCGAMDTALACIINNASNCHPGIVEEMYSMMKPGVMDAGMNCSSLTKFMEEVTSCPVVGVCPLSHIESVLMEAIRTAVDQGASYQCNSFLSVVSSLRVNISSCNSLETHFINYLIQQFAKELPDIISNTCLGQALTVVGNTYPEYDNYTKCAQSLSGHLTTAMQTPKYGFYDICLAAKSFNSCVTAEFEMAKRPTQVILHMLMNQTTMNLQDFLKSTCSHINESMLVELNPMPTEFSTCKADIAIGCVTSYAMQSLYIGSLNVMDMENLCGAAPYIHQCMTNFTDTCSDTVKHQLQTMFSLGFEMVLRSGMCPQRMVDEATRSLEMYMMEVMSKHSEVDIVGQLVWEWMEMKEDYAKSMMEGSDSDKEKEDKDEDDDEDKMCNPIKAKLCVDKTVMNATMVYYNMFEGAPFCKELEQVHACVTHSIEDCDDTTKAMVLQSVMGMGLVTVKLCTEVAWKAKAMNLTVQLPNVSMNMMPTQDMDKMEDEDSDMPDMAADVTHRLMRFMWNEEHDMMDSKDMMTALGMIYAIAPEDGECVDYKKYMPHGKCVPSMTMSVINAVREEMLNPFSTQERLCLKYSIAARIYMLTAHGCDYATSYTLGAAFELLKYHMGNKCPTVVKSPCQDEKEDRCRIHEIEECLTDLYQTLYAGKYFLPSSVEPMCMSVQAASKCLMDKARHCDARTNFTLYDSLRPTMTILEDMCTTMPALACVTSFMWKSASILLLSMDIERSGSEIQKLNYMKEMNITIPADSIDKMLEEQGAQSDNPYMNAENMEMVMKWLHGITSHDSECEDDKEDDDMMKNYGMTNVLTDTAAAIKYAFMDARLTEWEPQFKATVEMAVKSDDIIMTMVRAVGESLKENNVTFKESEIMQSVIRYVVTSSDSTQVVHFYFSHLVKAKINSLMPMDVRTMEIEDEMEEMMMDWIKKEIVTGVKGAMDETMKIRGDLEAGMKLLHEMHEDNKHKKMSMCYEVAKAAKCMEMYEYIIPHETKALVDVTMAAIGGMAKAMCEPSKCFSCVGQRSNMECNKQGMQTCEDSQGCSVLVQKGLITKSCAYRYENSEDPENLALYCDGNYCNAPAMESVVETSDKCKPGKAIQCLFDVVPIVITSRTLDMGAIFKAGFCISESTERCVLQEYQQLGDVGWRLRHATLMGVCPGSAAEYQCGLRSVLHLSSLVNSPLSTTSAICHELEETIHIMQESYRNNMCSDYEAVQVYQGLETIFSIIGPYACPNIMGMDTSTCPAEILNMKSSGTCDLAGVETCITDLMMDEKIQMLPMMDADEKDGLCRDLWTGAFCVMPKILSCTDDIKAEIGKNISERLMIAINHCPAYRSVHENCLMEPQYKRCEVGVAISQCMGPYLNVSQICLTDETKMTATFQCLYSHLEGCNVLQATPVVYLMEQMVAHAVSACGPSPVMDSPMITEKVLQDIMAYTNGYMLDSWRMDMPVSKMFDVMTTAVVMMNKQKDFNSTEMYTVLSSKLQNATGLAVTNLQMALATDETQELAKCALQLTGRLTRALTFPSWSDVLTCEALTATHKCLAAVELSTLAQMNVWSMMNKLESDSEKVCHNYVESVMYLGSHLTNKTAQLMNRTMPANVQTVLGHMMNGTLTATNITASDVFMVLNSTIGPVLDGMFLGNETCDTKEIAGTLSFHALQAFIGPFTAHMEYPSICLGFAASEKTIMPEIEKCSKENQAKYHATMDWIKDRTDHVCQMGHMKSGESTCDVDEAMSCLQYFFPYVKSKSVPAEKLCAGAEVTMMCMDMNTKTCTTAQLVNVTRTKNYLKGMVGNSCPYLTAVTSCYDSAGSSGSTCNATQAIMCTGILGYDPSTPLTSDVCSKFPQVIQCVDQNLSGCTNKVEDKLSVKAVMSYLEVAMVPFNKVCSKETIANHIYAEQNCQAPPVCSFNSALKCYQNVIDRETCSDQEATDAHNCAMKHLEGCNPVQVSVFNTTLWYGRTYAPGCKAYEVDQSVVPPSLQADQAGINYCISTFTRNVAQAMNLPEHSYELMCQAFMEGYSCLHTGLNEEESEGWNYVLGDTFGVTSAMIEDMCAMAPKVSPETIARATRPADYEGCSLTIAADCLSVYATNTFFASGFTLEDKMNYCNESGNYAPLWVCSMDASKGCKDEDMAGLAGLQTFVQAIQAASRVCSKDFKTCQPMEAANCGFEAEMMVYKDKMDNKTVAPANGTTDKNTTMWNKEYCDIASHQIECINRYTYGCAQNVHMAAVQTYEGDFCIAYDLVSTCPDFKPPEALDELPNCMDKEAKGDEVCDVKKAMDCFMELDAHLSSPFMQCPYMKETYVKAYQCFERNTKNCREASWVTLSVVMKKMEEKVQEKCPDMTYHACMDLPNCQADEGAMCLRMLHELVEKKVDNSHVCMAIDLTGLCVLEKAHTCTGFLKRPLHNYFDNLKMNVMRNRNMTCEDTIDTCAEKAVYNTIAIVQGEVMMAEMLKKEAMMVDGFMMGMMNGSMEWTDMMGKMDMMTSGMNNTMDTAMASDYLKQMAKDNQLDMMDNEMMSSESSDRLMNFSMAILRILTREAKDYSEVYTKVKVMECLSAHQSFSCVGEHLKTSNYRQDTVDLIMNTMTPMYTVVSHMCEAESMCSIMEEPKSCQLLPVAMMVMMQTGNLMKNTTHFCMALPDTIEKVKAMTEDCSSDIRENFDRMNSFYMHARDTLCRVQVTCEEAKAQKCIDDFNASNRNCSQYESTLSCVTMAIIGCNMSVTDRFNRLMEETRALTSAVCEKLPPLRTNASSTIRVIEGGQAAVLYAAVGEAPSEQCEAGKTCEIKVKISVSQDDKSVMSCPSNRQVLPQLVVAASSGEDPCMHTFTDRDWQRGTMIALMAQSDLVFDGVQDANVSMVAEKYSDGVMVLSRQIAHYKVAVADTDQPAVCALFGNNVFQFDTGLFDNRRHGEFVLYKHKKMPYEVRTVNIECNNGKTCTCAAIIKMEDDVFVFENCRSNVATPSFYLNGELTNGTQFFTQDDSQAWNIMLPTGTIVHVGSDGSKQLNVIIVPSSLDWLNTEGLCGMYDGVNEIAAATSFDTMILQNRIENLGSMLRGTSPDPSYKQPRFCTCSAPGSRVPNMCADMLIAQTCPVDLGQEVTAATIMSLANGRSSQSTRQKRQASSPLSDLMNLNYNPPQAEWRNWTEETATNACNKSMSTVMEHCQAYVGEDFIQGIMAGCVLSIKVNDAEGDNSALDTLKAECVMQVNRAVQSQSNTPNDANVTLSLLCDNNCNSNGQCVLGTCRCFRGFAGADCSQLDTTIPSLTSLGNDGLCQVNEEQCNEVYVNGNDFIPSLQPTCHFQMATLGNSGFEATGDVVDGSATFITVSQVRCSIPAAMTTPTPWRPLYVSVSNDGVSKSQSLVFVMYNSMCYDCDAATKQCSSSDSGCVIDNVCHGKNDVNPSNACQLCNPRTSTTSWTHIFAPNCPGYLSTAAPPSTTPTPSPQPTTTPQPNQNTNQNQVGLTSTEAPSSDDSNTALIIVSVVAGLLLLVCIILGCKMCHERDLKRVEKRRQKYNSRSSPPSSIEDPVREYDNFAYEPQSKGAPQNVYTSGLLPGDAGAMPPKSFPEYTDKVNVESEDLSKL